MTSFVTTNLNHFIKKFYYLKRLIIIFVNNLNKIFNLLKV